jgi:hypothetical protein
MAGCQIVSRFWPRSPGTPDQGAAQTSGAMFQRIFEIDLDRTHAHTEKRGDLVIRHLLDNSGHKNLPRSGRKLRQRPIQRFNLLTALHNGRCIRGVIRDIEQSIDGIQTQMPSLDPPTVRCDIERNAKQEVIGTVYQSRIGDAFDAQECLLQRLASKLGGPQTSCQTLEKTAVIGGQTLRNVVRLDPVNTYSPCTHSGELNNP